MTSITLSIVHAGLSVRCRTFFFIDPFQIWQISQRMQITKRAIYLLCLFTSRNFRRFRRVSHFRTSVIPAKAGIQVRFVARDAENLDSRLRGNDEMM